MRWLVDTHALYWSITDPRRVGANVALRYE